MSSAAYDANAEPQDALAIKRSCLKFLSHHRPISASAWLASLASDGGLDVDFYGEGQAIGAFESEMAARLGKPAAIFFPSGVMAQQAALRVACDNAGCSAVALHPRSHIAAEEEDAYQHLHGLKPAFLTDDASQPTAADFEALDTPVGSLVIELPLRRVSYALPNWDELQALSRAARRAGVWVHMDGARLWETTPFYRCSAAQIAELADSLYVSLYKGLGGIAGAVLAGPEAFIAEARLWRRRHGGVLKSAFPLIASARQGLARHLPNMASYVETARTMAAALNQTEGLRTTPTTPQVNAFQVHFPAPAPQMQAMHMAYAAANRVWLFDGFRDSTQPGSCHADVTVGDALDAWDRESAVACIRALAQQVSV